jgi:hypothetical protein
LRATGLRFAGLRFALRRPACFFVAALFFPTRLFAFAIRSSSRLPCAANRAAQ